MPLGVRSAPGSPAMTQPQLPSALLTGYADLAARFVEGRDFVVEVHDRPSTAAVVAIHGDPIERGVSRIARRIAGTEHRLYLLEGRLPALNYEHLHLASSRFDDPRCLDLIAGCERVVTIHGCNGVQEEALLGGLDETLRSRIAAELAAAGVPCRSEGHRFPGRQPSNICNRGGTRMGVQIELTDPVREGRLEALVIAAVRAALA
jgi:phage replication-related protein YjqB (UPF0714/DUF867 family)